MRPLTFLGIVIFCATACGEEDPCGSATTLEFGFGTVHTGFDPIEVDEGIPLVIGSQGSPMFDDVAMRATGVLTTEDGPTRDGWSFRVEMDGEALGTAVGRRYRRSNGSCGTEIVDLRVIPDPGDAGTLPRAIDIWDREVVIIGSITDTDGRAADATLRLKATRP